jgi:hypothetical protein
MAFRYISSKTSGYTVTLERNVCYLFPSHCYRRKYWRKGYNAIFKTLGLLILPSWCYRSNGTYRLILQWRHIKACIRIHALKQSPFRVGHFMFQVYLVRRKTRSPASASDVYRPSDRQLSAKLMPTFANRGCHVVRVTDLYGRIPGFLDRSRYFFLQVAPQLYSRGWVNPFPDPLLVRKSGSAGNRTRTSGSVIRNSDH